MIRMAHKPLLWITLLTALTITSISTVLVAASNDKSPANINVQSLSTGDINALEITRIKLKSALDSYKNSDLDATRHDLDAAIKWLNKALQSSKTEKSREESRQLAIKIDQFRLQLSQMTENNENSLIGFWHQSTAIIEREIDQLIHGYMELETSEKTLKHLLDAKMDLYTAEHDLFVSHSVEDSVQKLDSALEYLKSADQVAKKSIKKKINDLSKKINLLKAQAKQSQDAWKMNDEIVLINEAKDKLTKAMVNASQETKSRIKLIEADIQTLLTDVERNNIKNNYDSVMKTLRNIIDEL